MPTTITYDSQSPWTGTNSPYVSISYQPQDFGGTWVNVKTITLSGSVSKDIVGNLDVIRNNIISTFSVNNKTLSVAHAGGSIDHTECFVDSVSFPKQNQIGKLDYSITLRQYDFVGMAANTAGRILQPKDTVEAEEQRDGSIRMSHTVSAQGIDATGVSGMETAISFVKARIATVPTAIAHFKTGMQAIEMEEVESFNRLASSYSVTKTYSVDGAPSNNTHKRSSVSVSSSLNEDFEKVDITVQYKGGKPTTLANLVSAVDNESVVYNDAVSISGVQNLHDQANSFTIDESIGDKTVTLKASFDNNSCFDNDGRFFDYEVSLDTDYITGVTKVDVSGELKVRGDITSRNTKIDNFISATDLGLYLRGFAGATYSSVVGGTLSLGETDSLLVSKNEGRGTLRLSASFNDEDFLSGYSEANWSMNVNTPVAYTKTNPSATQNGHWSIQYFGFTTRETASVSVNLTSLSNGSGLSFGGMISQAQGSKGSLFGTMAGSYYTLSEDESTKDGSAAAISQMEQRSYSGGGSPLIVLGAGGGAVPSPPF